MPNWCEGVLKVRGSQERIIEFLKNAIEYKDYKYELKNGQMHEIATPRECPFNYDDDGVFIENTMDLHFKGTYRMFVNSKNIDDCFFDRAKEVICIDIRQAWSIKAEDLEKLSKEYGLDFRIFATEKGMEFCQLVEVIGGEIKRNDDITFDDFVWESPDNRLGG